MLGYKLFVLALVVDLEEKFTMIALGCPGRNVSGLSADVRIFVMKAEESCREGYGVPEVGFHLNENIRYLDVARLSDLPFAGSETNN